MCALMLGLGTMAGVWLPPHGVALSSKVEVAVVNEIELSKLATDDFFGPTLSIGETTFGIIVAGSGANGGVSGGPPAFGSIFSSVYKGSS